MPFGIFAVFALAVGCSIVTGAYDFRVGPSEDAGADGGAPDGDAAPPDTRACALCPEHPELAHPPCATASAADAAAPSTYFFAVRSIDFGGKRASWTSQDYAAGLDQDCSDRPEGGAPTSCHPPAQPKEWVALPRGIDNAFGAEVIAPLAEGALSTDGGVDIANKVTSWISQGRGGMIVVVDGWNGAADDDAVGVRLSPAAHPADGGAPGFARDESWTTYATEPSVASVAYVTGSTLVADFGSGSGVTFLVGNVEGALLELHLYGFVISGKMTESAATLSVAANIGSGGQRAGANLQLLQLAVGCDPALVDGGLATVMQLLETSYDLAVAPGKRGGPCNATSVGLVLDAVRVAGIAAARESQLPTSCP